MDFKALRSTTLQTAKCNLLFDMKKILSLTRRAIEEYNMISDGDHIAVGLSGGKDSIVLLSPISLSKICTNEISTQCNSCRFRI